jgi:amidase
MDALLATPATALARMIGAADVSVTEVVRMHLDRIAQVQPRLRAMLLVNGERALEEARVADAAVARGEALGPLHGVPFTAKDNIESAGDETMIGVARPQGLVAERDAVVVRRLRDAGAILLGKSAIVSPIEGFGSNEAVHGRVANPYDVRRSPGGSSGGEAAIIAAGGSACGLGNDSGGSVRMPAALCGLATLKPTAGLVPMTGDEGGISDPRTQTGALARTVADVALLTALIAGPHPRHPDVAPVRMGEPGAVDVPGLRVAVLRDNGVRTPTPEVTDAVDAAAAVLRDLGASVKPDAHPQGGHELTIRVWASYRGEMRTDELYDLLAEWDRYRRAMLEWMQSHDALLTPVHDRPAPLHADHDDGLGVSYTTPYSLTGWPCAVVRCGTSAEGTPIGVQVVARPWCDHVALAVAAALESELAGWRAPAGAHAV